MSRIGLAMLALGALILTAPATAQEEKAPPYTVSVKAARTSLFPGQEVEVTVTVTNEGEKPGPEVLRASLVGKKSFVCAAPPTDGGENWSGEWADVLGDVPEGGISLHPGESFSTTARMKFPDAVADGARAIYLEWRGRGVMTGAEANQLIFTVQDGKNPVATVETSMGNIVLELWPDKAPNHVANFVDLAQKKFWDDRIFHRVIRGFMVQTGCPNGDGSGDPGYTIPDEFNDTPFKKGVLGMAKRPSPNSAGSQFFVCVADALTLNGKYTAFGRVLEGQDVADRISNVSTHSAGPTKDRPLEEVKLKRVRVVLPKGYEKPEIKKNE